MRVFALWKLENSTHQSLFFFSPARWLLDIHQQITISISEVGREEGQGIVESESQKKKRERKQERWSKLSESVQESLG